MGKWTWITAIGLAAAVAAGGTYGFARERAAGALPVVHTTHAQRADVVVSVQAPGTLTPVRELTLRTSAGSAVVTALQVKPGERVKAGQVLAHLDSRDLTAPFDGTVLEIPAREGDSLSPGAPVVTLGVTDTLLARIRVDETQIGAVKPGEAVTLTASSFPGKPISGKVEAVAPEATPGAAGAPAIFEVQMQVPNADGALRPGMSIDCQITADRAPGVLTIPEAAVVDQGGTQVVFVRHEDTIFARTITTGLNGAAGLEVKTGLAEGDEVVDGPYDVLATLKDGAHIRVDGGAK